MKMCSRSQRLLLCGVPVGAAVAMFGQLSFIPVALHDGLMGVGIGIALTALIKASANRGA